MDIEVLFANNGRNNALRFKTETEEQAQAVADKWCSENGCYNIAYSKDEKERICEDGTWTILTHDLEYWDIASRSFKMKEI